jgi:hypothetical protein
VLAGNDPFKRLRANGEELVLMETEMLNMSNLNLQQIGSFFMTTALEQLLF